MYDFLGSYSKVITMGEAMVAAVGIAAIATMPPRSTAIGMAISD